MEILEGNGQHSLSWFRQRIGKISGSNVGLLMKAAETAYLVILLKVILFKLRQSEL